MPQELVLFLREFQKANSQPVKLTAQALQISRTLDSDGFREAAFAKLSDRRIDLPDRAGNKQCENQDKDQGAWNEGGNLPGGNPLCVSGRLLQGR